MLHAVPEMAEEDSSVVADKLEVVGGGKSGVHEADQQQRHAISALEYTLTAMFIWIWARHAKWCPPQAGVRHKLVSFFLPIFISNPFSEEVMRVTNRKELRIWVQVMWKQNLEQLATHSLLMRRIWIRYPHSRDSDNDDSDDAQTHQRVCKTVAKKWPIRSGRGKDNKILPTVSKQHEGKLGKSKIKHNSMMKDQDVEEILLSSILNGEEIPLEHSLFSTSERSQLDDDTVLPLKFYFGYEEQTPPEKSECEKELDNLWTDMDFAIASSAIGHTDFSMDKNEVEPASEVEQDQATLCSQGKHQLIHDHEIGIICKFCSFVQLEIKLFSKQAIPLLRWRGH